MREKFSHHLPLLFFTSALIAAAGLAFAALGALVIDGVLQPTLVYSCSGLTVLGGLITLTHLGHPRRSPFSLLGLRHSWLSREVLSAGLFFASSAITAILVARDPSRAIVPLATTAVLALTTLGTIAKLYALASQLTWKPMVTRLAPFIGAALLAAVNMSASTRAPFINALTFVVWALIGADIIFSSIRIKNVLASTTQPSNAVFPSLKSTLLVAFALKLALLILIGLFVLLYRTPWLTAVVGALILIDRFVFYAGSAVHTPTAEVKRVNEERLAEALK